MIRLAVIALVAFTLIRDAAADTPWWTALEHPGLDRVIEQGLDANPDPVAAAARLREARQLARGVRAERQPSANVSAAYRVGRENSAMTGGVTDDIDPIAASATLAWELDLFGRVGSDVAAAKARTDMRVADAEAVRLALSLDIARTYIELSFRDEQVGLLVENAEDARAIFERAERRAAAGLDNPTDVERIRAAYQQAEHRSMQAGIERDQLAAVLRDLLGGEDPVEPPGALASFNLPEPPDLARTNLHLLRPDVVSAHQAWVAAQGDAAGASRERLPSLSLVVSAAGEGEDAGDPDQWEAWAGPVIDIPLWQPRLGAGARAAAARSEAAEAAFVRVSHRAVREIDSAWAERSQAEAMSRHMEERFQALSAASETMQRKREAGLVQESDRLESRMAANDAAIAHARWTAAGLQSHVQLVGALGGQTSLTAGD